MMDGRLKTLHPKIHGGILARVIGPTTWPRSPAKGLFRLSWWW